MAAWLAPAIARATLLPACEGHDQMTRMPAEWAAPTPTLLQPKDACDAGAPEAKPAQEDLGDTRVAAMCDERGASVIAPPRILPMTDARIEAAPGCGFDPSNPVASPGPQHGPVASASPALAEHAVLDGMPLVPPASSEPAPPFPPIAGGARTGFHRGIDHPPR